MHPLEPRLGDSHGDLDLLVTHLHSLSRSPAASAPRSTSRRLSAGYLAPRTNHGPNFPPPADFCSSDSVISLGFFLFRRF
ncbi:hypothetical protein ACQJBY_035995 [Aegilops geniculata]